MISLSQFLKHERQTKTIYPKSSDVFRAFLLCPYDKCKVVMVFQDPYSTGNNADGLAVSCKRFVSPTLKVILNYLELPYVENKPYTLEHWAEKGILLLNTALTVEKGKPNSHKEQWHWFTREVLKRIKNKDFLLFGNNAKSYAEYIEGTIYTDIHPVADVYNKTNKFSCGNYDLRSFLN